MFFKAVNKFVFELFTRLVICSLIALLVIDSTIGDEKIIISHLQNGKDARSLANKEVLSSLTQKVKIFVKNLDSIDQL